MKYLMLLITSSILFFSSCTKELITGINGTWILESTSGTFSGGGINTAWNEVVIDEDTFDLLDEEGESVASGEIDIETINNEAYYYFNLTATTIDDLAIELDPEKFVTLSDNKMDWISPCCDRLNYHFVEK